MHKAKHQLHIRHANRLHDVFNNIVSAIDPLLTKPVLTIMHKSTKTRQRQFQKYGSNTVKFRIAKKYCTVIQQQSWMKNVTFLGDRNIPWQLLHIFNESRQNIESTTVRRLSLSCVRAVLQWETRCTIIGAVVLTSSFGHCRLEAGT